MPDFPLRPTRLGLSPFARTACLTVLLVTALLTTGRPALAAPQTTYPSIAAMCEAEGLAAGATVTVEAYRQAGDGGGGRFRYDPKSDAVPDAGAVLEARKGPGRFLRVVAADEDAFAEWFGAYGDGESAAPHADQAAINACLAAYGRVKLLAKTYGVRGTPEPHNPSASYHAVDLGPYYRIIGAGREATKIKLLDNTNPPGGGPGDNYFVLLANRAFHESADYLVIRDLTIDCNFDQQNKHVTIHAIGIRGGGALVERLNLRGYGTGRDPQTGSSRECFVVHQTLVYKDRKACRRAAVYRDLDLTGCGHNGKLEAGAIGEITHLCLGGSDNFDNKSWIMPKGADPDWDPANGGENENNWWPSYGGLVEDCVIHDEAYDPEVQKSPLNGITYSDCVGLTVRGNRVENWEGAAIFVMSWWNRDTTIVDNKFLGVTVGLALNMVGENAKPVQCPRHENVLFAGNEIVTGTDTHAPWGMQAISLFAGDMPAVVRMRGIHIIGNRISGRAYPNKEGKPVAPLGLKIQMLRPVYEDIRFEDNLIDLPDYSVASWVPQEPYSQSLMFFPLEYWQDVTKTGKVVYRNNRNPAGKVLYPLLVDFYFKNPAVFGKP